MSDDERVYSDEEFALILRKATELASRAEPRTHSSTGLTLTEMKAASAQVGLDPALVERAARLLAATPTSSPLERLIGGPLRHVQRGRRNVHHVLFLPSGAAGPAPFLLASLQDRRLCHINHRGELIGCRQLISRGPVEKSASGDG